MKRRPSSRLARVLLRRAPSLLMVRRVRLPANEVERGDLIVRKGRVARKRYSRRMVILHVPNGTVERRAGDVLEVVVEVRRRRRRRVRPPMRPTVAVPF